VLLLSGELHVVSHAGQVEGHSVAQHGASLDLLVLLADVEAVDGRQLDLVPLYLSDPVDDSLWTHLAEETEVQLL